MGNQIPLPYSCPLPSQIKVGDYVIVHGRPHPNCNTFSINLCCGPTMDHDVALHFNPRFHQSCVVRNSKHNGKWANEERDGHIPFSRTLDFQVQITAKPTCFEIMVNNRRFCNFKYRMSKEMANYLFINGEVSIIYVEPIGGKAGSQGAFPPFGASLAYPQPDPPPYYQAMGPINNPPVPLSMPVHGGMAAGRIVYMIGRVNQNAQRFTVNLMCGPSSDYDIALHFDVRLRFSQDINVVVRNAKQNGRWGPEEREMTHFPFMPGTNFELMIMAESSAFKIAVNNQHYTQFNHRIHPYTQAAHLNVTGDITLTQLRFQ